MQNNALACKEEFGLVPTNPKIVSLSTRWNWRPQTLIRRIESALPAPMEQQLYLTVANDFRIRPESVAKLLRMFLGRNALTIDDLNPVQVEANIYFSRIRAFSEFLRECLNLLRIVVYEYDGLTLTIEQAGQIVLCYGTENPELIIELIDNNLDALAEFLGVSEWHSYNHKFRLCVWLVTCKVIPQNREIGHVDPLEVEYFLSMSAARRNQIRRALNQEIPDYLSEDFDTLSRQKSFNILKEEGLL